PMRWPLHGPGDPTRLCWTSACRTRTAMSYWRSWANCSAICTRFPLWRLPVLPVARTGHGRCARDSTRIFPSHSTWKRFVFSSCSLCSVQDAKNRTQYTLGLTTKTRRTRRSTKKRKSPYYEHWSQFVITITCRPESTCILCPSSCHFVFFVSFVVRFDVLASRVAR